MSYSRIPPEVRERLKPQAEKLLDKLTDLGIRVRTHDGMHYTWHLIAEQLHYALCYLDNSRLEEWDEHFPDLIKFANLYAKDNHLRHIEYRKGE
ncbi:MAG: hypothetical protein CMI60_18150 [Parvibaculum sp.]|nr:hypothetical protein [Parvibaculum sp.]